MFRIAPSLLPAGFGNLAEAVGEVASEADWVHVDVMDAHFVPDLTHRAAGRGIPAAAHRAHPATGARCGVRHLAGAVSSSHRTWSGRWMCGCCSGPGGGYDSPTPTLSCCPVLATCWRPGLCAGAGPQRRRGPGRGWSAPEGDAAVSWLD